VQFDKRGYHSNVDGRCGAFHKFYGGLSVGFTSHAFPLRPPRNSLRRSFIVICDANNYPWGRITSWEKVPSLVNRAGNFFSVEGFPRFLNRDNLNELEVEFRAQIETVLAAGLKPAHLDWYSLRLDGRADTVD